MNTKQQIKVELEFFAILKDILNENLSLYFDNPLTIGDLKKNLIEKFPQAEEILRFSRFSTEDKILEENTKIEKNQKIYVLPPSSGG
ncbi:MAG: hypothetical protein KatS3mg129_1860 [Leptospiraceae bacterium]|nr:MAG: hypothetical protein KatS3mg129_1860 [Leptospiraceae bacterium]